MWTEQTRQLRDFLFFKKSKAIAVVLGEPPFLTSSQSDSILYMTLSSPRLCVLLLSYPLPSVESQTQGLSLTKQASPFVQLAPSHSQINLRLTRWASCDSPASASQIASIIVLCRQSRLLFHVLIGFKSVVILIPFFKYSIG